MNNLRLPENNKIVWKILFAWYWWWAWYLEYQKSKKIADAMAENEANKIKIAWELEEKVIREQIKLIENLEQADKFIEYKNLYWVLTKAVPKFQSENLDTEIDPDKLKRLKDLSKEFSSDEMQEYIAWILAWEYNKPWSYSLKTMEIVKNLSRDDINLFKKFCWLLINWDFIFWNFFQLENQNHFKLDEKLIWYNDFLYLQELWLFVWEVNTVQRIWSNIESIYQFYISNKNLLLKLKKEITLYNQVKLTKSWRELYNLIWPIFDEELFNMCKEELLKQGFEEIN